MDTEIDTLLMKDIFRKAVEQAQKTMRNGEGGPFGAVIIDTNGTVYAASNNVLAGCDPTAHAEVQAIRMACAAKKTHDLSGCVLYATCYPCPMCLSACIWANIKEVWYGSTPEDAAKIGFRDDFIYDYIRTGCTDKNVLSLTQAERTTCQPLMDEYARDHHEMY